MSKSKVHALLAAIEEEFFPKNSGEAIAKTADSWQEFARKTRIRSGKKLIAFEPYSFQVRFVDQVLCHSGTVAIKTRQLGFTECVVSLMLFLAAGNPAFLGVIFSKNQDDTINIARRCRIMIAAHPELSLETSNLKDLKLKDGGRLVFKPSTPNSARSLESVSFILFDECAFVSDIEEIYGSALPATEMLGSDPIHGAKIVILSTPNGRQGFYWQRVNEHNPYDVLRVCEDIRTGKLDPVQYWTDKEGWCKFIAHWKAHPVYRDRPNYLEQQKSAKRLTEAQVQREYNLSFEASIARVFKDSLLEESCRGSWESPKLRHSYLVGIDPSFGGEDFFTVRVWDVSCLPYRLVGQYRDRQKSIDQFIGSTLDLLDPYYEASGTSFLVSCESNAGGALVYQQLIRLRPEWQCECVSINKNSKLLHTDRLVLQLERGQMLFPPNDNTSPSLISNQEYAHFIQETVGAATIRQAESGWHDDTVMADAIAFAHLESVPLPVLSKGNGSDQPRSARTTARFI